MCMTIFLHLCYNYVYARLLLYLSVHLYLMIFLCVSFSFSPFFFISPFSPTYLSIFSSAYLHLSLPLLLSPFFLPSLSLSALARLGNACRCMRECEREWGERVWEREREGTPSSRKTDSINWIWYLNHLLFYQFFVGLLVLRPTVRHVT